MVGDNRKQMECTAGAQLGMCELGAWQVGGGVWNEFGRKVEDRCWMSAVPARLHSKEHP